MNNYTLLDETMEFIEQYNLNVENIHHCIVQTKDGSLHNISFDRFKSLIKRIHGHYGEFNVNQWTKIVFNDGSFMKRETLIVGSSRYTTEQRNFYHWEYVPIEKTDVEIELILNLADISLIMEFK